MCVSVYPLMKESLSVLMQRTPLSLDHAIAEGLRKVWSHMHAFCVYMHAYM